MTDVEFGVLNKLKANLEQTHDFSSDHYPIKRTSILNFRENLKDIASRMLAWQEKRVIDIANSVKNIGFRYTGNGNTVRCEDCDLEITNWKSNLDLLTIHSTQRPDCPSTIHKNSPKLLAPSSPTSSITVIKSASISNDQENPSKRQKIETSLDNFCSNSLFETDQTQQIRRRTFSQWPHRTIPSQAQMIEAGFFNCNVGDRVICIYCNLICQQWTPHTDDPCEIHKTLSPNCIYVKAKLIRRELGSILIVNETAAGTASGNRATASNNLDQFRNSEFVHTAACNAAYTEIPKRAASFAAWSNDNLPAVDDLVRAGFFYTGTKSIVTCFYCNGSLQNWGPNDNPTIEHARWFPHCAYAKQLCGDALYRKIQESKRAQQERARTTESKEKPGSTSVSAGSTTSNSRQLLIPDESTLSRLVAARLDLPISQRLLDQKFKLSIIKRSWEDQLRLKHDDFVTDSDLYMACLILQKQIEYIDGKKENIIIPSIKMKKIRDDAEKERAEAHAREQAALAPAVPILPEPTSTLASSSADVEMTTSSSLSATNESTTSTESITRAATTGNQEEIKVTKPTSSNTNEQKQTDDSSPVNPCVLCLSEEKRLACIPCGHLATCVPCGHSLKSCPICRREIEAFVRIYI